MVTDCIGQFYDENGIIKITAENKVMSLKQPNSVYEVIRVIEGVALFIEEHFSRLVRSFNLTEDTLQLDIHTLWERIIRVVKANAQINCNVKIIISSNENKQHSVIYISKSYYPSAAEIKQGVAVDVMMWEREQPNAKVINQSYKQAVENTIKHKDVFEVLLVNAKNEITEGSRSNVFFIKSKTVYTPPATQVLKGITREYVLDACKNANMQIVQSPIKLDMLGDIEALFLTGTSIKVLPVRRVGNKAYFSATHQHVIKIKEIYDNMISTYIISRKQ